MGYHLAGFDVTGVDVEPQPNYPFTFVQADAMTYPLDGFDVIHASPPCHDWTTSGRVAKGTAWMLPATLDRLRQHGAPFVVENVLQSRPAMPSAFLMCGRAVGITGLRKHRLFTVEPYLVLSPGCACPTRPSDTIGVYGDISRNDRRTRPHRIHGGPKRAGLQTARDLIGCPWMDRRELTQAIPPAYTEWIGRQLIDALTA